MKKNLLAFGLAILSVAVSAQTPRLCLYEEFTGETCPPCASTNPGLNALLAANASKIIAIKWQVPIPSAPSKPWSLYQTNKPEIDWRYRSAANGGYGYNPAVTYAPFGKIDGQSQAVFGTSGTNADHPANLTTAVINTAQSYTSAFSITMQRDWNENCSAVTLTINVTASANFTATGNLVFRTVLVERVINFSVQPGTNGEKDFYDAARKSYPSIQAGTPLPNAWTIGQSTTFTLNCVLPTYLVKKEEAAFVGFIQDEGNKTVKQACRADKAALPTEGLAAVAAKVDVTCSNAITPMITVQNTGLGAITNIAITPYIDGVAGALINWTGNIPASTSSVISLGSLTAPTTPGSHTFSYTINNLGGTKFNLTGNSSMVTFLVAGNYNAAPVAEGFVLGAWPPAGWTNVNSDQQIAWTRNTQVGGYFLTNQSAKYDFFSNTNIGDVDELILPPLNLSGNDAPDMSFDYAYAQRTSTSNDKLEVKVSDDCGATWSTVFSKSGSALSTVDPQTSAYQPSSNDFAPWVTALFTLNGFNKYGILVKFVVTNDNGNNLYLDNVNLVQRSPTGIRQFAAAAFDVNVYPNPANGSANIQINGISGTAKVSMINTLGQVVYSKQVNVSNGNTVSVDLKDISAGVYNVVIDSATGSVTKKLTVTK
jgi:hypothetical protein